MTYKKQTLSLLLLGLLAPFANAQNASLSSGGNASGVGGSASYSIGQALYSTHTDGNNSEIQGVQQPYEISTVTKIKDVEGISLFLSVYPNPTSNELNLKIEKYPTKGLTYQLTDINGRVLTIQKIESELTQLSLSDYTSTIYFLSVLKNNQLIKSFKIFKN